MTTPPGWLSIPEFALRTVARAGKGDWLVLVAAEALIETIASRVKAEVESLGNCSVEHIKDVVAARELVKAIQKAHRRQVLIVSGIDALSEGEWKRVDLFRSRFMREQAVVLIMSKGSLEHMARSAPNLVSWIGGSVWEVDVAGEYLSDAEREARLASLREWSRLTDADVLQRAADGTLPKEPEFVEWLILLGRADLLEHS